ncbi:MAG: NAD(P)H-dependent oxidoreductase subunit E [bacterium]
MIASPLTTLEIHSQERETPGRETVSAIVDKHGDARGALIAILEEIQATYGYLPAFALHAVAERKQIALVDVYGVATFYRSFSLQPRGKCLISVCLGTACHVREAPRVAEEFERQLGVRVGGTTSDGEFTLETVNCLGACALGPIVAANGRFFSNVTPLKVKTILKMLREQFPLPKPAVA